MIGLQALSSPLWVLGTGTSVGKLDPVSSRRLFQTGVNRADHPEAAETLLQLLNE